MSYGSRGTLVGRIGTGVAVGDWAWVFWMDVAAEIFMESVFVVSSTSPLPVVVAIFESVVSPTV